MNQEDLLALVAGRIDAASNVLVRMQDQAGVLAQAAEKLASALEGGGKLLFCGNGGSAADALHLTAELTGRFKMERPALAAIALPANPSAVTAIGNDYGFDKVFARQVEALGRPGDALVGLSTSGNSRNVIEAMRVAAGRRMFRLALTGQEGGRLAAQADLCLRAPSTDTPRIQEAHILAGHILCELIERLLGGPAPLRRRSHPPS